jgi:hypothetical protein
MFDKFKGSLFSAVYYADDCPDGDAMFLTPFYIEWAKEFEEWLNENDFNRFERTEHDDGVVFTYDQQSIWFANDPNICPYGKWVISAFRHSSINGEKLNYEP